MLCKRKERTKIDEYFWNFVELLYYFYNFQTNLHTVLDINCEKRQMIILSKAIGLQ